MIENKEMQNILKEYDQEHILKYIEKLEKNQKEKLIEQIQRVDFNQLTELYQNTKKEEKIKENKIEAIPYLDKSKLTNKERYEFETEGEKIIKSGKYAVVTMAGGQGSRLGHQGPKGTFKLDVYGKSKYIFEILSESLKEANTAYDTTIPWYIMTSKENNQETKEFFKKNNYFGYDKKGINFFMQSGMPLVDMEGKVLIGKDMKIKEASDGNGGVFSSLRSSGALADMKERNIKWIFIGGVDNVLAKLADITLIGMAENKGVEIASKSILKASPHEKVGVFCKMNDHPKIIEYSELPKKMAEEVDNDGELKYGESNILSHLFTIEAIEKISKETIMYHSAIKKNSYINEEGKEIIPNEPNTYKFEAFIFDSFGIFDEMAILRVEREDEFAPVKNKEGVDSPKTAKELYEKYWQKQRVYV